MRFVLPRFCIAQFVVLFIVMKLLRVYCGFFNEIGRFKNICKIENIVNGGEHKFFLAGSIDNHKILKGD